MLHPDKPMSTKPHLCPVVVHPHSNRHAVVTAERMERNATAEIISNHRYGCPSMCLPTETRRVLLTQVERLLTALDLLEDAPHVAS